MGCDKPVPRDRPVFHVSCGTCGGEGRLDPETPCPAKCDQGAIGMLRCPAKLVEESPHAAAVIPFMQSYMHYDGHGILPAEGGYYDQAALWWSFVRIVDAERGEWIEDS